MGQPRLLPKLYSIFGYLVPVRNNVDRLISWYNYESYRSKNPNLVKLIECFPDANSLITNGLDSTVENDNQTFAECKHYAKSCFTGQIPCYAHNYYNYEVYVEDLLHWKECHQHQNDDCSRETEIRVDVIRLSIQNMIFEGY